MPPWQPTRCAFHPFSSKPSHSVFTLTARSPRHRPPPLQRRPATRHSPLTQHIFVADGCCSFVSQVADAEEEERAQGAMDALCGAAEQLSSEEAKVRTCSHKHCLVNPLNPRIRIFVVDGPVARSCCRLPMQRKSGASKVLWMRSAALRSNSRARKPRLPTRCDLLPFFVIVSYSTIKYSTV